MRRCRFGNRKYPAELSTRHRFRLRGYRTDAQQGAGKRPMDHPDSTVDRTTNGHGREDLTDAELRSLRCTNNAVIPELSEALDLVMQQSHILNKKLG